MISYEPLFATIQQSDYESLSDLITKNKLSHNFATRIQNNEPMTTTTINNLCSILNCPVSDIIKFKNDNNKQPLDKELKFILDYAEQTDFACCIKTDNGLSNEKFNNLKSLYIAYCIHNGFYKKPLKSNKKAILLLKNIHNIIRENKSAPFSYKNWTYFENFILDE